MERSSEHVSPADCAQFNLGSGRFVEVTEAFRRGKSGLYQTCCDEIDEAREPVGYTRLLVIQPVLRRSHALPRLEAREHLVIVLTEVRSTA